MSKPTVGIIGFGDFAQLLVRELGSLVNVYVSTRQSTPETKGLKIKFVDDATALSCDTIIPCMPAQALEQYFTEHREEINPKAVVVDISSVKVKPVEVLTRVLPETVQIIATHPLFGPQSAKRGVKGQKIMMYPVRINKVTYELSKQFVKRKLGLQIIECTPEEHDQMMAYVQGLSHYIGRAMQIMDIPETELATKAYNDLLDMRRIQANDSWELFQSIMFENQFTGIVQQRFKKAQAELDQKLGL